MCCQVRGCASCMRAIVGHALDRSALNLIECAQADVTALNSHGVGNEVMVASVM
jgi:hypothetical protein